MPTFSSTDAQNRLGELIDLALQGHKVFIQRDGTTFELAAYRDKNEINAARKRVIEMMRSGEERTYKID